MDSEGPYDKLIIIIAIVLLMLFNGFLTSIYTSIISLNQQKLKEKFEEEDDMKAKELLKISSYQSKIMQINTFVDLLISLVTVFFIFEAFRDKLERVGETAGPFSMYLLVILIIIVYLLVKMIFTIKIPQRIGVRNPYALASNTIAFSKFIFTVNGPFISIINSITGFFMNIFGIEAKVIEKEVTAEQIKSIVQIGEDQGILRPLESKMIYSIMSFDDVWAEEVMTARTEVFMIDIKDSERKYLEEFVELRHSRIPVYDDEIDNILGIIYTKDYLLAACKVGLENVDIRKILRPAHFVPDKIETDKLFQEMQRDHIHLSLLIDEYGGFSGIVTMEDLLEEIVGDIDDLFDKDSPEIRSSKNGICVVKGSTSVKDLNEEINIGIDEDDDNYDTVAGFMINQLGYIPKDGSSESIIYNGYELKILYVKDTRIKVIRIRKLQENPNNEEDENPSDKDEKEENNE